MIQRINKYLSKNYLPRWIILFFDVSTVAFSLVFAHLLINKLHLNLLDERLILRQLSLTLPIYFFGFILFRPFTEIIRHSTISIIKTILVSLSFSGSLLLLLSLFPSETSPIYISALIITLQYFISLGILITSRVFIKTIYNSLFQVRSLENKILIYGAGELGQMAFQAINKDRSLKSKVIAYADDNSSLHGKRIGGIPVISLEKAFKTTSRTNDITEVIIAIAQDRLKKSSKRRVVDLCIESGVKVREIPLVSS
ncbi:MAG: hypothetical protein C0591_15100 [Marinilabiliales bacterium]|nr:MAG: hypothetical protein C0591_15100 [Marinilabiliales bacterium]